MKPMQESRIDLGELKGQIVKRIGTEKAKKYFYYLNRLLSQKLSKTEFDKLCYRMFGREHLPLHNQFIRSILKNALHAKTPPPTYQAGHPKTLLVGEKSSSPIDDGHEQSGSIIPTQIQAPPIWSNGVVLPLSPRKGRSGIRDRKLRDRPSPLGPNGKIDSSQQSGAMEDSGIKVILENGDVSPCDYKRPLQHLPIAEQPENEKGGSSLKSVNRQTVQKSRDAATSPHSEDHIGVAVVENADEMDHTDHLDISRSPLLAPLGIPLCPASIGGACKSMPLACRGNFVSYSDSGGLSDTETLKRRMEQIAVAEGLGGVSTECANILNNTVDVYLKRLIKSCTDLVKSRQVHEPGKHQVSQKQNIQPKLINGLRTSNHYSMQNSGGPLESVQEQKICSVSLVDFRAAMELNQQQLGEDWPMQLEKICMRGFEE